jgi:hypothetical protein
MKFIKIAIMTLLLSLTSLAYAMNLQQAKSQGYVGEKSDGFIAIIPGNVPADKAGEVQALVTTINQARLQEYQSIASNNGASLDHVESVANQTLVNMAKPGDYIQDANGHWVKKGE